MSVYVERRGRGPNLVLLHGWGMNGAVWDGLATRLADDFTLHLVDLPGFGHSAALPRSAKLNDWVNAVLAAVPHHAAWLGWSLGGLLATQAAFQAPARISHLITLASSPCFVANETWPGIKPEVLAAFEQQLAADHQAVINRFLALQAMGSEHAREDIRQLKESLAAKPAPDPVALAAGLALLGEVDLRAVLGELQLPLLRLYGRLDGLVPRKVIPLIDALLPESAAFSECYIEAKASHAAFISHPDTTAERIAHFLSRP